MSERSSKAFLISVLLHGGAVGLVFLFTYVASHNEKDQPKIFELVAGEGDNYGATEAPALGSPGGVKVDVPSITAEPPAPEPPAPQPEPPSPPAPQPAPAEPETSPVKPVETKPVPKPVDNKTPDFSKMVKRKAAQKEARIVAADKKKKAEEERKAKIAAAAAAKISKAEFDKQNAGKNKPPSGSGTSSKVSRVDAEGIRNGVVNGSTNNKTNGANGKALSRAEQDMLDAYISMLIQRLRTAHEKPPGLSDLLQARVRFDISSSGVISNATIVRSSGSEEFDQSVLAAFSRVKGLGAPPNGKSDTWTVTFKMHEDDDT